MCRKAGITFAVYGEDAAAERIIPFDIVPRVISSDEWARLERGLEQRVSTINAFLCDIYGRREILSAGLIPEELVLANPQFRLPMTRIKPPHGVWAHIRSEEHTSELQSLMRISYAVFCLKKKTITSRNIKNN